MHDWLVGLVLEVAVPSTAEVWSWPRVHLVEFLLSRANLDTSIDAIGGKWAGALDVPFIEDSLLDLWFTADEVVETFGAYEKISYYYAWSGSQMYTPGLAR